MTPLTIALAGDADRHWCQQHWIAYHYLHRRIDPRCSVLAYVVMLGRIRVGAIGFGRPESTVTRPLYGGLADLAAGRVQYSRWSILNMARVWLHPDVQRGGRLYVPNAATQAIAQCLHRVVVDYLLAYPVVWPDEPWRLEIALSYCDFAKHDGALYRAAGFTLARTNERGIGTFTRPLRGLQPHERRQLMQASAMSERSRRYRAQRAAGGQLALDGMVAR